MLDKSLIAFALLGAQWVLYLLIVLSIISVGIMIERAIFFARRRVDSAGLGARLAQMLAAGQVDQARSLVESSDGMEARVAAEGLRVMGSGAKTEDLMSGELTRQRSRFERRLLFLGTLGNNAPFVGLFGTVLGIIKAFHDLSLGDPTKAGASAQVVMAGISEALVATAVGLAVALPAVVAFNYFKSVVKGLVASSESLQRIITAHEVK
jgi:biopolymer transport protein ExbB